MKRATIIEIISALFILLFTYTALSKLYDYENFRSVLYRSPYISFAAPVITWALPIVELVVVFFLFFPRMRRVGLIGSLMLMIIFTFYIGFIIITVSQPKLPCSCGGVLQQMSWQQHLLFNIFFTFLAWMGLRLLRLNRESRKGHEVQEIIFSRNYI
ncbi:MAG: hypothetical protein JST75_09440 [Bacteroidetes bacterium]|nr:hypothetical protein [Bacteroidota bacterium]